MKVSLKKITVPGIPLASLVIAACLTLWLSAYWGGRDADVVTNNKSLIGILQTLLVPNSLFTNLVCIGFTLLNGFLLSQFNNEFAIIRTRTFLPFFIYLILMSSSNETHQINGSHISLTLFIISLFYFLKMWRKRDASEEAFMGSLIIGVSSLIINPLIFLIPIFWIGFMIFQSFSLRTFLASVLGALTPWIFYLSILYYFNPDIDFLSFVSTSFFIEFAYPVLSIEGTIYALALAVVLIICLIGLYSNQHGDSIHTRKKLNLLGWLIFSMIILSLIFNLYLIRFLPIIFFLFALLVSHSFTLKENNFYGVLFIIFCVLNLVYILAQYIII